MIVGKNHIAFAVSLLLFWTRDHLKIRQICGYSSRKIDKFETFFNKHGEISTLSSRLIHEIRQHISLPTGLAKMNIFSSCPFTTLNARAWCAVLLGVGYFLGLNPDKQTLPIITITILAVVAVISAVYIMEQFRFQVKGSHFS